MKNTLKILCAILAFALLAACATGSTGTSFVSPSPTVSPSASPSPAAPSPDVASVSPSQKLVIPVCIYSLSADIDGDGTAETLKFKGGANQSIIFGYIGMTEEEEKEYGLTACPPYVTVTLGGKEYRQDIENAPWMIVGEPRYGDNQYLRGRL